MQGFYIETPGNATIEEKQIKSTFTHLTKHPEKGTIIVFEYNKSIVGYAILLRLWSNEFSKDIVFIDELYVQKDLRNKGIGTDCIRHIIDKFKNNAAVLILAVEPGNEKAKKLYQKLGFKLDKNETLVYQL